LCPHPARAGRGESIHWQEMETAAAAIICGATADITIKV